MKTLTPGSPAPDFDLPDQGGERRSLTSMLERGPVVLFFYPAAMSGGCTREVCRFRDLEAEFAAVGAQRVGISMDGVQVQGQFARQSDVDFPLLSDADGATAVAYGVRRRFLTPVKRVTFVIDVDQTIHEVVASEMSMDHHADAALAALRTLARR
ncbi:MAG TPA: peroxiredoxin [Pedococcus sp.]|jgi:peroxiredoxin Q/BCP